MTFGTTAELTDLEEETYIAVVVCISVFDGYTVNSYVPLMLH